MKKTAVPRLAVLTLGACALLPAALPSAASAAPIVIAHRGASGYLPEHTLAAYELAVEMGADYVEPDLQFTSDGVLVAMHDDTLERTTDVESLFAPRNGGYAVSDFTLAEIKRLTVTPTGTASTSFPGFLPSAPEPFSVPTFEEVLELVDDLGGSTGRTLGIYPEAKQADPAMEDAILSALQAHGYQDGDDRAFIQSFSAGTVASLNEKQTVAGSDVPLVLLGAAVTLGGTPMMGITGPTPSALPLDQVSLFADGVGVVINSPLYEITDDWIAAAHEAGLLVHGWTFSQADPGLADGEYRRYLERGMDGLFSNYPDLAVAARDAHLAEVPEPGALALLAGGLAGLAAARRRRPGGA